MGRVVLLAPGYLVSFVLGALGLGLILFGIGCGAHDPIELLMHLIMPGIPGLFLIYIAVLMWRFLVWPHHKTPQEDELDSSSSTMPDENAQTGSEK